MEQPFFMPLNLYQRNTAVGGGKDEKREKKRKERQRNRKNRQETSPSPLTGEKK